MAGRVRVDIKNLQAKPLGALMGLSSIIQTLPSLTKQDLRALQAAVDAELSKNITIDIDLFYMVFDVANEKPMSVSKFSNSENGTIWRKNQPIFEEFLNALLDPDTDYRITFIAALKRFLINLIIEDIKEFHMPLTLRTICQQLSHIEAVFNKAYPGYIRNGLQRLILAQLGGK